MIRNKQKRKEKKSKKKIYLSLSEIVFVASIWEELEFPMKIMIAKSFLREAEDVYASHRKSSESECLSQTKPSK